MKKSILLILAILLSNHCFTQNLPEHKLEQITVTATRIETPLNELAASTTVLTEADITKLNKTTVLEILRDLPGVALSQPGGLGKIGSVFLRGGNSNHLLVLVDGVEVNDPSSPGNSFDFAFMQTDDIRRIEIIRGPQSTLYGSDAMSGVINIYTKAGTEQTKFKLYGETGSYSTYKLGGNAAGKIGNLGYSLNANRTTSDGISAASDKYGNAEGDFFKSTNFSGRLNYPLTGYISADAFYKFTNAETGLDQTGQFGDDPNFVYDTEENLLKAGLNGNFADGKLASKLSVSAIRRITHAIDEPDDAHPGISSAQFNNATRLKYELENQYNFARNMIAAFGGEYEIERAETEYNSESSWGTYNSIFPQSEMTNTGIYLLTKVNFSGNLFLSAGVRYDDNSQFGGEFTYRFAPAYFISATGTKLKFTYGTGFKAPSLYNLFDPLYGNPDLKPEKSKGWDAGIEQFLFENTLKLEAVYFNTNYSELVDFDQNFKPVNISKAVTRGVEFSADYSGISGLNLNANLTFLSAEDDNESTSDGERDLYRRPGTKVNLSVSYELIKDLNFTAVYKYTGIRYDRDFSVFPSQRVSLPDYSLFNFSMSYQLNDTIRIYLRAENVFDNYYEDALYYGSYGRSIYGGASLEL